MMKDVAREIFQQALARIDVRTVMRTHMARAGDRLVLCGETFDLRAYTRLYVIAFGKAALAMAGAVYEELGPRITFGIIVTNALPPHHEVRAAPNFLVIEGGHPLPNRGSVEGAERILEVLRSADEHTLVIFLVSGGGSAMIEKPIEESITVEDLQQLNRLLVTSGATIAEINAVRKHLSAIKGGRLAAVASPARQVTLYISDVNPGDFSSLASNPTGPDETTLRDFYDVIERYDLLPRLPERIARLIREHRVSETPKPGDPLFSRSSYHLLMDNQTALQAAADVAAALGCRVHTDFEPYEGYYRDVADHLLAQLVSLRDAHARETVCLIAGGEVSCPVRGSGIGGRNQEFVLYAALRLPHVAEGGEMVVLSAGTDGIDGTSPAAGAVADTQTVARARALGLDPERFLAENDSYTFFHRLGDTLVTGPTGNNVRDLRILLARRPV
jgi:hydroxypyruvate reductase